VVIRTGHVAQEIVTLADQGRLWSFYCHGQ
jgi:hypothetical protein